MFTLKYLTCEQVLWTPVCAQDIRADRSRRRELVSGASGAIPLVGTICDAGRHFADRNSRAAKTAMTQSDENLIANPTLLAIETQRFENRRPVFSGSAGDCASPLAKPPVAGGGV